MKTSIKFVLVASIATAFTSLSFAAPAQEIWNAKCKMCHGADGNGTTTAMGKKPGSTLKDYTSAAVQAELKDEELLKAIKEGVKDTKMPPYADKYSEEEIASLVALIRSQKK